VDAEALEGDAEEIVDAEALEAETAAGPVMPELGGLEQRLGKIKLPNCFMPVPVQSAASDSEGTTPSTLKFKPLTFKEVEVIPGVTIQPAVGRPGEVVTEVAAEEVAPQEEAQSRASRLNEMIGNFKIQKLTTPMAEVGQIADLASKALENPLIEAKPLKNLENVLPENPLITNLPQIPGGRLSGASSAAGRASGVPKPLPIFNFPVSVPKISVAPIATSGPVNDSATTATNQLRAGLNQVGFGFQKLMPVGTMQLPKAGDNLMSSRMMSSRSFMNAMKFLPPTFGIQSAGSRAVVGTMAAAANTEGYVKHVSVNSDSLLSQFRFDGDFRIGDVPVFIDAYDSVEDGTSIWDAGIVLGQYLAAMKDAFKGDMLELGAGTGVAGLCRAVAVPDSKVILTDTDSVIHVAAANVEMNQLAERVTVLPFDWESDFPILPEENSPLPYSFVVAADVLWHRLHIPKFFEGLLNCVEVGMKVVLVHARRSQDLFVDIQAEAAKTGFEVNSVEESTDLDEKLEYRGHSMCQIWVFTRLAVEDSVKEAGA